LPGTPSTLEFSETMVWAWLCAPGLRRELGLSYRIHQEWIEFDSTEGRPRKYCEEQVHVDFYNDAAQSWFQLKYLNL
jgi:hypothetical protein